MALKDGVKNLRGGNAVKCKAIVKNLADNKDVFATDADGNVKEFDGRKFELPVHVIISAEGVDEPLEFDSNTILMPKKWNKKFYTDKDDYVRATVDHVILWLFKIAAIKDPELMSKTQFDINDLEEMPFDAMVVQGDDYCFIDWVNTLIANGVSIPTAEELNVEEVFEKETTSIKKTKEFVKEAKAEQKADTQIPAWKR